MLEVGFISGDELDFVCAVLHAARDAMRNSEMTLVIFFISFLSEREDVYNIPMYHVIND